MPIRFHYSEFLCLRESIVKNVKLPIYHIYAFPYPYGETTFDTINDLLNEIKRSSNCFLEIVKFEGSHHFHMLNPARTAKLVAQFLFKHKSQAVSSAKL
jgi:hypothetical protein